MLAPAKTLPQLVARFHALFDKVLATAAVQGRLAAIGSAAAPMPSSAHFGADMRAEQARWGQRIRERGIKGEQVPVHALVTGRDAYFLRPT